MTTKYLNRITTPHKNEDIYDTTSFEEPGDICYLFTRGCVLLVSLIRSRLFDAMKISVTIVGMKLCEVAEGMWIATI